MDKNIFLYFMYFHVSLKRRVIFTRNNDVIFVKMSKIYKSNPLNVFFLLKMTHYSYFMCLHISLKRKCYLKKNNKVIFIKIRLKINEELDFPNLAFKLF